MEAALSGADNVQDTKEAASMGSEVQRILQMFNASDADMKATDGLALGFVVLPVNLATGQHLAKPQLLSRPAAMAAHNLLMKLNLEKQVSSTDAVYSILDNERALPAAGASVNCVHA